MQPPQSPPLPWVQDGITHTERTAIKQLYWLSRQQDDGRSIANLEAVLSFPWVQDNITYTEETFIDFLESLDDDYQTLVAKLIAFPWPQDSITDTEADTIKQLYRLTWQQDDGRNAANLKAVLRFPWVQDDITETEAEVHRFPRRS